MNTPPGWTLVWSDEFDGPEIDTNTWRHEIGHVRNKELQVYTDRPENARIEDGILVIEGREEEYEGFAYTSASLHTKGTREFTYGRFEARLSVPMGRGLWPAFWLLGVCVDTVGWPDCGELDVMEHVNAEAKTYGTVHWNEDGHAQDGSDTEVADPAAFHVYTMEWDPAEIRWCVDGVRFHTVNIEDPSRAGLHTPQYIILNLAIGGTWPGPPDGDTQFPAYYRVDYVRVYQ